MSQITCTNQDVLQIVKKTNYDVNVGGIQPLLEPGLVEDVPVGPQLVHGNIPQLLGVVPVGGDQYVGNEVVLHIPSLHLEADEVHEPLDVVHVSGTHHHGDISVVTKLEVACVDECNHAAQGLGVDVFDEDLVLLRLLHVPEDHGAEHRGPEDEKQ